MSDSVDPQAGGIEVSPEEERFLRGFVRRQLLPWAVALLLLGAATAWSISGGDASDIEARTAAALAQVRSENQELRAALEALRAERAAAPASHGGAEELERRIEHARAEAVAIEQRITAQLDGRLRALEAQVASGAATHAGAETGPPPDASAWDVSAILDRLYALEMRDGGSASSQGRLGELERRVIQLEAAAQGVPLPAASSPGY